MMKKLSAIVILIIHSAILFGQDPYYSQYYSAPMHLNPAFAGSSDSHRFIANHRRQWPSIPNSYSTFSFSYDFLAHDVNSGFGLLASTDKAGTAGLNSSTVGFLYSYKIRMGGWILAPGLNMSWGSRSLNFNKLVFGDQLAISGPTRDEALGKFEGVDFMDFSAGLLIYNKELWIGYSVHHLNEPNLSLMNEVSILPQKHSIHGGITIPLYYGPFKKDRISTLAPSFVYRTQGPFDQLDLGLYYIYQPIAIGVWYRGIPVRQSIYDNVNHDAVAVIFGLRFDAFQVGYSYDVTISDLHASSGGAHELSLIYEFVRSGKMKRTKPQKYIPCPVFYGNGLAH